MKRIVLANAPISDINRGCVALTLSSMYLIDLACKEEGVDYELFLPNSGLPAGVTSSYNVAGINIKYHTFRYTEGIDGNSWKIKLYLLLRRQFKQNQEIMRNADAVFDIGLGDSFSDLYGIERFKGIDLIHKLARRYHKPYFFLPQTIGPFARTAIRDEAMVSLMNANGVMVRDLQSYDYVKQNLPNLSHIKEYLDVAFFLPYQRITFDDHFVHVGINISDMLWRESNSHTDSYGLTLNYGETIKAIIEYFLAKDNVKVHLIAHLVAGNRFIESDYTVCYDMWEKRRHPNLILAPFFLGPVEAKNYISGLDLFIGARMHADIAAFSSGVPVLPMAYSRKFNGLFVDTLNYGHLIDMKKDSKEIALKKAAEAYENHKELKEEIKEINGTLVASKKEELLEDLKTVIRQI